MTATRVQGTLLLVNRTYPLLSEPESNQLCPVSRQHPEILLLDRAKVMLDQLLQAVGGESGIIPVSGYRPCREQQSIWDKTLLEHGRAFTETYVAQPGCSEHQTGLAIDLGENKPPIDYICPAFPDSGICRAFRLRAADYGFILRYPEDKQSVTGIGYEPWHFRYVGWPHARIMEEHQLVLEEYIDLLKSYTEQGPHLNYHAAGRSFELFYLPNQQSTDLKDQITTQIPVQLSDDNTGGVVVTLWRSAG